MENENKEAIKPTAVTYYGKKAYRVNPLLARLKLVQTTVPDYRDEVPDEKRSK